jgi:hypothetical protein
MCRSSGRGVSAISGRRLHRDSCKIKEIGHAGAFANYAVARACLN